ncbi:hypothetical protein HAV15_003992 [Penicillium sp. str. |nr:hypothetical protein HAV15_003992 [Penicillium sp. str. \
MFAHQVRLQRIAGEVENARNTTTCPPAFYLIALQHKVNEVKAQISPHLQQEAFETFFKIPLVEYYGISFPFFTQLARYLIVLSKLSTLNDPRWDNKLARSTVDVLQVIDQLINNIQHAKAADGDQCMGGPLDKSTWIFTSVRAWCAAKLAEGDVEGVHGVQGGNTGFQLDGNSGTQLEALFLEDAWWRGSFDASLGGE